MGSYARSITQQLSSLLSAGNNQVINIGKTLVYGITVGTGGATSSDFIEVSDHPSLGTGNLKFKLVNPGVGYYPMNAVFQDGLTVNVAGTLANIVFHFDALPS